MNKQHFNSSRDMKRSPRICLSSDGSWNLSNDSNTSLTSVRARYAPELSSTVAATNTVSMVRALDAQSLSVTFSGEPNTDEESFTERQSIDLQSIDEPTSEEVPRIVPAIREEPIPTVPDMDDEPPTVPAIDKKPTFTIPIMDDESYTVSATDEEPSANDTVMDEMPHAVSATIEEPSAATHTVIDKEPLTVPFCATGIDLQQVHWSKALLSFGDSYGKVVSTNLRSLDDGDVTHKRPVQAKVLNPRQVPASNPGGDTGNPKPIRTRCGAPEKTKNVSKDMKFSKRVGSADIKNREKLVVYRPKPLVVKNTFKNKKNVIKNVYMSQTNKVSTKPAPFMQRSSSYINRQAMQRETDRNNYKIMKKLMNVKATVSSFR